MSFWDDDFDSRPKSARWAAQRDKKGGGRLPGARGASGESGVRGGFDGFGGGFRASGSGRRLVSGLVALAMLSSVVLLLLPFGLNRDEWSASGGRGGYSVPVLAQASESGEASSSSIVRIAEHVKPAVVSVINHPEKLPGEERPTRREGGYGLGSGIIFSLVKDQALVVTNHHVIDGGAQLEVVLTTGERREAELIGSDVFTDLAVLVIAGAGIEKVAQFGDSNQLKAGEGVVAIGNPLGISYAQTITAGIVSSLRTPVPISLGQDGQIDWEVELIQTDAAINRGNSGGALVNMNGEVIGINSMKVTDFGVEGLGFAIPINEAIEVIGSLLEHGKVKRAFIGVATMDLSIWLDGVEGLELPDDVEQGVIIMSAEGPAAKAGLQTSDVIVALDDVAIDSTLALRKYLYEVKAIGDQVKVTFYREGKKRTVTLKLEERER